MSETPEDLAMRARMAEADAAELRETLIQAVFRGTTRPSNKTLLDFAVKRIEHSRRIAPDNPDGLPLPSGTVLATSPSAQGETKTADWTHDGVEGWYVGDLDIELDATSQYGAEVTIGGDRVLNPGQTRRLRQVLDTVVRRLDAATLDSQPQAEGAGDPHGLDLYGTGDESYPEPKSEGAGDRTVNDPPGFVASWCPDCSTVGGHDIDCPHRLPRAEDQRSNEGDQP